MEAFLRGVLSAPPRGPCKFSWLSSFWSVMNLESPSVPGENLGFCLSRTLFFHEGHDKQPSSLFFQARGQFLKPQLMGDGSVVLLALTLCIYLSAGSWHAGHLQPGRLPLGIKSTILRPQMLRTVSRSFSLESYSFGTCSSMVNSFLFLALRTLLSVLVLSLAICVRSVECWIFFFF